MTGFRGHSQSEGGAQKGPLGQRELVSVLRVLIDTAKGKSASRTRDDARATLRDLLSEANWNTPYVLRNIGAKRCRYLSGIGWPVPSKYALRSDVERLHQHER